VSQPPKSQEKLLNEEFVDTLNSQGYSYQQRVICAGKDVFTASRSPWRFLAQEFPIRVQGKDRHIDFILKHTEREVYLVAECKRANPAYCNWCFVEYVHTGNPEDERATILEGVRDGMVKPYLLYRNEQQYHLGFEMKSGKVGDKHSYAPGKGIDEAASQVCRGVNGLAYNLHSVLKGGGAVDAIVVPVIFTTANLYISDLDLFNTDLVTGNIQGASSSLRQVEWLAYRYHQSPSLRHEQFRLDGSQRTSLRAILTNAYARTIYIVNSNGIETFYGYLGDIEQYP
jgi:hypothetical protein